MVNWQTISLKQNTISTETTHIVECFHYLFFAENFFVLKIITVDLRLQQIFNSCIRHFTFKWQEVFCGLYVSSLGREQFCSKSCWVLWVKSHLFSVWPHVIYIDFKCFEGERAGCWHLHQAAAAQEPALALMQSLALVFSNALASGHWSKRSPSPALEFCSLGRSVEPFAVCFDTLMDKEDFVQTRVFC